MKMTVTAIPRLRPGRSLLQGIALSRRRATGSSTYAAATLSPRASSTEPSRYRSTSVTVTTAAMATRWRRLRFKKFWVHCLVPLYRFIGATPTSSPTALK